MSKEIPSLVDLTKSYNEQLIGSISDAFMNLPILSWDNGIIGMIVQVCAVIGILKLAPLLFTNKDKFFTEGSRFLLISYLLMGMYGKIDSRRYIWDFNLPPERDYTLRLNLKNVSETGYRSMKYHYAAAQRTENNSATIDRDLINALAWFLDDLASAIEIVVVDSKGQRLVGAEAQKKLVDDMTLFMDQSRLAKSYCTAVKGDPVAYKECLSNLISPDLHRNAQEEVMCGRDKKCWNEEQLNAFAKKNDKRTIFGKIMAAFSESLSSLLAYTTNFTSGVVFPVLMWVLEFLKQVFSLGLYVMYTFITAGVLILFKIFAPLALVSNSMANVMKSNLKTLLATACFPFVMQFFQTMTTILLIGVKNATYMVIVDFFLATNVTPDNVVDFSIKAEALMNLSFIGVFIAGLAQIFALWKTPDAAEALLDLNIKGIMSIGKEVVSSSIMAAGALTAGVAALSALAVAIPVIAGAAAVAGPALAGLGSVGAAAGAGLGKAGALAGAAAGKAGALAGKAGALVGKTGAGKTLSKVGSGIGRSAAKFGKGAAEKASQFKNSASRTAARAGRGYLRQNKKLYGDFLKRNVLGDVGSEKLSKIVGNNNGELPSGKDLVNKNKTKNKNSKVEDNSENSKAEESNKASGEEGVVNQIMKGLTPESKDNQNNVVSEGSNNKGSMKKRATSYVMKKLGSGLMKGSLGAVNATMSIFEAGMTRKGVDLGDIFSGKIAKGSKTTDMMKSGLDKVGLLAKEEEGPNGEKRKVRGVTKALEKGLDVVAQNPELAVQAKRFYDSLNDDYSLTQFQAMGGISTALANQKSGSISIAKLESMKKHAFSLENKIKEKKNTQAEIRQYQELQKRIKQTEDFQLSMNSIMNNSASNEDFSKIYTMSKGNNIDPVAKEALSSSLDVNSEFYNKQFADFTKKKEQEVEKSFKNLNSLRTVDGLKKMQSLIDEGSISQSDFKKRNIKPSDFNNIQKEYFKESMSDINSIKDKNKSDELLNRMREEASAFLKENSSQSIEQLRENGFDTKSVKEAITNRLKGEDLKIISALRLTPDLGMINSDIMISYDKGKLRGVLYPKGSSDQNKQGYNNKLIAQLSKIKDSKEVKEDDNLQNRIEELTNYLRLNLSERS